MELRRKPVNKLFVAVMAATLVLAACNNDYTIADTSLNGTWLALNGVQLKLDGMSYIKTPTLGNVETGTYVASEGSITFSRLGHTSETYEYKLEFPQLVIGAVTYYHDSPSEPKQIEGRWFPYPYMGRVVTFGPAKRQKDENKNETLVYEGNFVLYMESKGTYTLSSRNLPGNDRLITTPTHIHGTEIFAFINIMMPIQLLSLFDQTILVPPEKQEDVEEWWFTLEEARRYFEESADKAGDLQTRNEIDYYMNYFLTTHEESLYDYSLEFDDEILYRWPESAAADQENKLTLSIRAGVYSSTWTYYKWNGAGELPQGPEE
jgi:hypothetical protein